jgi:hypothetical protein
MEYTGYYPMKRIDTHNRIFGGRVWFIKVGETSWKFLIEFAA